MTVILNILPTKGKVTVMLHVSDTFNENDLETLRIIFGEDITYLNNIVKVGGRKYCTFLTDYFSRKDDSKRFY